MNKGSQASVDLQSEQHLKEPIQDVLLLEKLLALHSSLDLGCEVSSFAERHDDAQLSSFDRERFAVRHDVRMLQGLQKSDLLVRSLLLLVRWSAVRRNATENQHSAE